MDVMIAGGGTGGHLFPGIALAQELRRRDPESRIVFVGTARGIEKRAVPQAGFPLELLPVSGLRRVGWLGLVKGLLRLPLSLWWAFGLVRRVKPQVAVSVGGYAAGPAVLAARLLGVRCVVMEQNAIAGFTNRVLGRVAHRVFAALPLAGVKSSKVSVVGNPVREDLISVRGQPYTAQDPLRLLVFGGSLGARALNDATVGLVELARTEGFACAVRHQTGRGDLARTLAAYGALGIEMTAADEAQGRYTAEAGGVTVEVLPFIDDMARAYAESDLVVCRSGATTLAELTVCGRPSILVPFPFAVDDHQSQNARTLVARGAAELLPESELGAQVLLDRISGLRAEPGTLEAMAEAARRAGNPRAAQDIADSLAELVGTGGAHV